MAELDMIHHPEFELSRIARCFSGKTPRGTIPGDGADPCHLGAAHARQTAGGYGCTLTGPGNLVTMILQ